MDGGSLKVALVQAGQIHAVFESTAFFAAWIYYTHLKRRAPDVLEPKNRLWLVIVAALGGVLGSRVSALLEVWFLAASYAAPGLCGSGRSIVGGLLGGLFAVELAKKVLGIRQSTGDLFVYPLILGMMVGRVGCFLGGVEDCTFGDATATVFGVDFGDGIARHPTQLYEFVFLGGLWLALRLTAGGRKLPQGSRFKIFMVSYFSFRLLVDFWKPLPRLVGVNLAATQVLCVVGLLWYAGVAIQSSRKDASQKEVPL